MGGIIPLEDALISEFSVSDRSTKEEAERDLRLEIENLKEVCRILIEMEKLKKDFHELLKSTIARIGCFETTRIEVFSYILGEDLPQSVMDNLDKIEILTQEETQRRTIMRPVVWENISLFREGHKKADGLVTALKGLVSPPGGCGRTDRILGGDTTETGLLLRGLLGVGSQKNDTDAFGQGRGLLEYYLSPLASEFVKGLSDLIGVMEKFLDDLGKGYAIEFKDFSIQTKPRLNPECWQFLFDNFFSDPFITLELEEVVRAQGCALEFVRDLWQPIASADTP